MLRRKFAKTTCAVLASASLVLSMSPATMAFAEEVGEETSEVPVKTAEDSATANQDRDVASEEEGTDTEEEPQVETCVLKFYSNGKLVETKTGEKDGSITVPNAPSRSGYRFLWWLDESGNKIKKGAKITFTAQEATLKAQWEKSSTIANAAKVVPYATVRASYSSGSVKSYGSKVKAGKIITVSNSSNSKRVDRFAIQLGLNGQKISKSITYSMGIKYRVRSGSSWSSWKADGKMAGTSGKRIEAVQVKLTGTLAKYYSVYYSVNAKEIGYLGWARDGASAGTSSYSRDLSGLKVILVKKSAKAPGSSSHAFVSASKATGVYSSISTKNKTFKASSLGKTAGAAKKSTSAVSRIAASATVSGYSGGIKYKVYKYQSGWTSYASNGKYTASGKKSVLAVKMSLTGSMKKYFDVYYRVYVKGYGWMGWAKNGQAAGNTAYNIPVNAYQMKVVFKGSKAPGSTSNYFSGSEGILCDIAYTKRLQKKANGFSSATDYLIILDCTTCRLGIFKGSQGNWTMIKYWKAGVGAYGSPTVKGTFTTTSRVYEFGNDKGYSCWYATQFYGNYLFHSIVYNLGSKSSVLSSGLGTHVSHGCCRLSLSNAKWLYYNIPLGTKVHVFGN